MSPPGENVVGNTQSQTFSWYNSRTRRGEVPEADSSHMLIDSERVRGFPEERTVCVIVHELLHALGFFRPCRPGLLFFLDSGQ